jgi:hypothetical protein
VEGILSSPADQRMDMINESFVLEQNLRVWM